VPGLAGVMGGRSGEAQSPSGGSLAVAKAAECSGFRNLRLPPFRGPLVRRFGEAASRRSTERNGVCRPRLLTLGAGVAIGIRGS